MFSLSARQHLHNYNLLQKVLRPAHADMGLRLQQLQNIHYLQQESTISTTNIVYHVPRAWGSASFYDIAMFAGMISDKVAELISDPRIEATFRAQLPMDTFKDVIKHMYEQKWSLWSDPINVSILVDFYGIVTHFRVRLCASNIGIWPKFYAEIAAKTLQAAFNLNGTSAMYLEAGINSLSSFSSSVAESTKVMKQLCVFVENQKTKSVVIDIPDHPYGN